VFDFLFDLFGAIILKEKCGCSVDALYGAVCRKARQRGSGTQTQSATSRPIDAILIYFFILIFSHLLLQKTHHDNTNMSKERSNKVKQKRSIVPEKVYKYIYT